MVVFEAGRIVSQGTPHEVMSAPLQESVAQLAGFENIFDAVVETELLRTHELPVGARVAGEINNRRREGRVADDQRPRKPVVLERPGRQDHEDTDHQQQGDDQPLAHVGGQRRLPAEQQLIGQDDRDEGLQEDEPEADGCGGRFGEIHAGQCGPERCVGQEISVWRGSN